MKFLCSTQKRHFDVSRGTITMNDFPNKIYTETTTRCSYSFVKLEKLWSVLLHKFVHFVHKSSAFIYALIQGLSQCWLMKYVSGHSHIPLPFLVSKKEQQKKKKAKIVHETNWDLSRDCKIIFIYRRTYKAKYSSVRETYTCGMSFK